MTLVRQIVAVMALGFIASGSYLLGGCEQKPHQVAPAPTVTWEYKLFTIGAPTHERTGPNALASNEIIVDEKKLNEFGSAGWELTSTWLEPETSFPNMSDNKYVTGIQSNVRPSRAVLLFRRTSR